MVISKTCPFVGDCGTSFVSLEDCHFFNVTQQKRVKTVSLSNTKAIVDSCDFSDMTTPYYGCIVSGLLSTGGFAVFNTSFRKCSYSKTVVNTVTTNGTEPVFFSDTYFNCKSEGHGGAIYHRINYPMTIERCMFFACNSSQSGGAIGTDNAPALSALIINNTIGEKYVATIFGGFLMSDYQNNMQMRNTNISDSHGEECGCVFLNRYPGNILIICCYFINCSEEGDRITFSSGGILIGDGHNVSISDCSLTKCSGLTAGGVCFWGDSDWGGDYTGVVMFCFFEENSARNGGKDVSVMGEWVENADQSMLVECRSKTLGSNRVMHGEKDVSEWIPYYYSGALYVNSETGDDNEACGKNERKCRTVGYIPVLVDPHKAESTRVVIESVRIVEQGCNVANKKMEIVGSTGGELTITTALASTSLFSVEDGHLSTNSIQIIHDSAQSTADSLVFLLEGSGSLHVDGCTLASGSGYSESNAFSSSMIMLKGGEATIEYTHISSFWLLDASWILLCGSCSLRVSNCTLEMIVRNGGEGGGISATISSGCELEICECAFDNCTAKEGNGGGVKVVLERGGSLAIGESTNATSFSVCSAQRANGKGGFGGGLCISSMAEDVSLSLINLEFADNCGSVGMDVYASLKDLRTKVNNVTFSWAFLIESEKRENSLCGADENFFENDVDLFIFITGLQSTTISTNYSIRQAASVGELTITIHLSTTLSSETVPNSHAIKSDSDSECNLVVNSSLEGQTGKVILTTGVLKLNKIVFSIPSSFVHSQNTLIHSHSTTSELTVNGCQFVNQTSAPISYVLFDVSEGKLTIEDITLSSISFSGKVFAITPSVDAEIIFLNVSNSELGTNPLFPVDGSVQPLNSPSARNGDLTLSLTFKTCTFREIAVCEANCSGIISTDATIHLLFDGCTFESVSSPTSDEGGAMRISVEESGSFSINGTSVCQKCSCENRRVGKGGFLWMHFPESHGDFALGMMSLKENSAFTGRDVFVTCKDLLEIVDPSSFSFAAAVAVSERNNSLVGTDSSWFHSKDEDLFDFVLGYRSRVIYVNSTKGMNYIGCGKRSFQCTSVDYGITRVADGEERRIEIGETGNVGDEFDLVHLLIESNSEETAVLSVSGAIPKARDCIVEVGDGIVKDVTFSLPDAFANGHSTLFALPFPTSVLTLEACSLTNSSSTTISFNLVLVNGGDHALKNCKIENIISAVSLVEVLYQEHLSNEDAKGHSIMFDSCSFLSTTETGNTTSIAKIDSSDSDVSVTVKNSTFLKCCEDSSSCGGALFVGLGKGSLFEVNDSIMSLCETAVGKGGGMYLNGADAEHSLLPFVISNVTFSSNNAIVGRDMFIQCDNLSSQISERHFLLDFREPPFNRHNSIWGVDAALPSHDVDIIPMVVMYQSELIFVNGIASGAADAKSCGSVFSLCRSLSYGVLHVIPSIYSQVIAEKETAVSEEAEFRDVVVKSFSLNSYCCVLLKSATASETKYLGLMECVGSVSFEKMDFLFSEEYASSHLSVFNEQNGATSIMSCTFTGSSEAMVLSQTLFVVSAGQLEIQKVVFDSLNIHNDILLLSPSASTHISQIQIKAVSSDSSLVVANQASANMIDVEIDNSSWGKGMITASSSNVSVSSLTCSSVEAETVIAPAHSSLSIEKMKLIKSTIKKHAILVDSLDGQVIVKELFVENIKLCDGDVPMKGAIASFNCCSNASFDSCVFDGSSSTKDEGWKRNEGMSDACMWNGSLVAVVKSSVMMKDTTISNSPEGGITMSGGNAIIEAGNFSNNSPSIEGYPSLRRNIICSDSGTLNVMSLKGGDGLERNTSLWMLNNVCSFKGIVSERDSSFFIPVLERVEAKEETDRMKLKFKGLLLIPCNLSFAVVKRKGEEKEIENFDFDSNGFLSEREVEGSVAKDTISGCGNEIEVSVCILFGNTESPLSTNSFVLKNKNETEPKGDEIMSKGEEQIEWGVIAFIGCIVIVMILLFVIVVVALLRKKLKELEKNVEKERSENEQILGNIERRRGENGGNIEMSEMPSTLLEGMTSQIPFLIENDEEDLPEPPLMTDDIQNENDLPDLESPIQFSENASVSFVPQSHPLNVISAKKPFQEKEKKNIKTLHSVIHSVQGNFTLGTRAMDVVDGKEVVIAVAELFEHLISVNDERVEMMVRQLCPYSIFVEEGNNEIFVMTEELEEEKQKEEMKRWKAPEARVGEEDMEKAAVFSLGLILHEMTTGDVPLSECEAEKAQKMMSDGVRQLTEGIDEEMVELMEQMWADEPDSRPKLEEVIQLLKFLN
ncbi:putative Protein tyrosine and serine/threonine kinase [Monocercomonoides exilis]|uniref:putative Protein tyrosine and serine/threonine kinase n=1 Tax=Monocercomonoides exilis TaxID=2049356 RepID=UPI003559F9E4|nr:putative Protein tyrosine and serine/threonine kinase [Monocercomonoides exilis]|eukprot:MONOS_222.1-p1 / transcript=MONOS_222.1 / gene=MONOS_222 / organism=Monocercomonoides_exilis_PA203 / gene_product=unspecified product / transcript_product=unspecified product / location=Mono_scaffold00004:7090-14180(+) / protein_length=2279 / sequence_SO=supercontig / SO=protein_coding / is_pseudo=false